MKIQKMISGLNAVAARVAAWLVDPLLLGIRLWVAHAFLVSGWNKLRDFDNTLFLFANEYSVPLLPPELAAYAGTAGEIVLPLLLIVGLLGRFAALGISGVNVVAVVSYPILLEKGFEAALKDHYLWGLGALVLVVFGVGRWSLDAVLERRSR
jgi:putative oxidoreductase